MQSLPGHRPWLLTAINRVSGQGRAYFFFGLSSDLEFFLNKNFFPIIKINRLPSITMEAQAVARDQHLARWKRVSIRFKFLALIMVVMFIGRFTSLLSIIQPTTLT